MMDEKAEDTAGYALTYLAYTSAGRWLQRQINITQIMA